MCGEGVKTRMLDCVRSDGKSVDLKFCQKVRRAKGLNATSFELFYFFKTHCNI